MEASQMVDWRNIHEKRDHSLSTMPLAGLSSLYGLGVKIRASIYARMRKKELPGFVVSIGNLTAGGTGKTPAAAMIAEWALKEGYRPAILSRGYGSKHKGKILDVSDGQRLFATPTEAGDEPYLLAKKLEGVPVIISKARYDAGIFAHQRYGTDFFILDDGFQHICLKRNLDLVLLDATSPFGNMRLLPRGPLREPVDHLQRADAFILTRTGHGTTLIMMNFLKKKFGGKPVFQSEHIPEKIVFPDLRKVYSAHFVKGKRVVAFAGIAKPEVFKDTLAKLGAEPVLFQAYKDHHAFSPKEVKQLVAAKNKLRADHLITTEKDWVRLEGVSPYTPDLAYLTIRFQIAGSESFFKMIRERRGDLRCNSR